MGRVLYSVPYRYLGQTLAVRVAAHTVEFYLDQELVKTHVRLQDGRRQTDWNDYPPEKAQFFRRTPTGVGLRRASLGPAVAQVVETLLAQHALHYLRQCQGIIRLADKYGPDRLNAACQVALAFGDPAYHTVRNLLIKASKGKTHYRGRRHRHGRWGLSSRTRAALCHLAPPAERTENHG